MKTHFSYFSNSFHTHGGGAKSGFIGCELTFKNDIQKPLKLIMYSVYHNTLVRDSERNAKLEYTIWIMEKKGVLVSNACLKRYNNTLGFLKIPYQLVIYHQKKNGHWELNP